MAALRATWRPNTWVPLRPRARAARDHPGLLERFPGLAEQSPSSLEKFTTLNGAFWNGGLFIYVPPGLTVEAPLYSMIATTRSRIAVFPRLLIWVDDGASLELVEEHCSETLDDDDEWATVTGGANARVVVIGNLTNDTLYNIQVRAVSAAGNGTAGTTTGTPTGS